MSATLHPASLHWATPDCGLLTLQPGKRTVQEELQRRRERAARFQTDDKLAEYQPAVDMEEEQRRRARAKKFGVAYAPKDETGLADAGALRTCVLLSPSETPFRIISLQHT